MIIKIRKGETKKLIGIIVFIALVATTVFADEYVNGYTRKDGTYVAPHYRSSQDSSYNNNYSTRGNQKPYTGEYGSNRPTYNDCTPSYNQKHYGVDMRMDSGNSNYRYKTMNR